MIRIDGSSGEGGGQILRTALGLSLVTAQPFLVENIRARRKQPGLLRQHLTAVLAAAQVGGAETEGAELGSARLVFRPGKIKGGSFTFSIGTAGSTTLVLQTVLPALLIAKEPSSVVLEGGTHNMHAPPFDFLAKSFVPVLSRMGVELRLRMDRYGFYPAGGGRIMVTVEPCPKPGALRMVERPAITHRRARVVLANLRKDIGKRELSRVYQRLGWAREDLHIEETTQSAGPGNALMLEAGSADHTEVATAFGRLGTSAENVADEAIDEIREYLASDAPVGMHLADQLLVPMALAGSGEFHAVKLTGHTVTNIETIQQFLPVRFTTSEQGRGWRVAL